MFSRNCTKISATCNFPTFFFVAKWRKVAEKEKPGNPKFPTSFFTSRQIWLSPLVEDRQRTCGMKRGEHKTISDENLMNEHIWCQILKQKD
jgi:hypothetical protein